MSMAMTVYCFDSVGATLFQMACVSFTTVRMACEWDDMLGDIRVNKTWQTYGETRESAAELVRYRRVRHVW